MTDIVWVTLLGQVVLPAAILIELAIGRCADRLELVVKLLAASAYGAMLVVVGVWLLVPAGGLWAYAVAAAVAGGVAVRRLHRRRILPSAVPSRRRALAGHAALGAVCLAVAGAALAGHTPPGPDTVYLSSPLRGGVFYAVNGGYSILINPHMKALRRLELAAYRGQSYAVDLVKLDDWGRRASGLLPPDPQDYFIFGEPVYAPCAGAVARTERTLPDRDPVALVARPPAGNFVLLDCGGYQVLLAHLMERSVSVREGERVQAGEPIGRVGNSGRSTEPHLHFHAQTRSSDAQFEAEPLPFRVNGELLVRGSRLLSPGPEAGSPTALP
jgi:hypothetical protein